MTKTASMMVNNAGWKKRRQAVCWPVASGRIWHLNVRHGNIRLGWARICPYCSHCLHFTTTILNAELT